MNCHSVATERVVREGAVTQLFLENPNADSFAGLFDAFSPQLIAFFRARRCELGLAEDLAQEVMFTVFRKAAQLRDRNLFRTWIFKIARNALSRHYQREARAVETVNFEEATDRLAAASVKPYGTPAFEFLHWMAFLDSKESEVMKLRFIEKWEYHEIAASRDIPIGTVQWRVFNAKKKLAPHLAARQNVRKPPDV